MRYPLPRGSVIPASCSLRKGGGGRERRAPETLGLRFWIGGSGDTAIDTLVCSVCPLLDRPPCDTQELIISAGLLPKSSWHGLTRAWEGLWTAGLTWTDMDHQRRQMIHRIVPQPHFLCETCVYESIDPALWMEMHHRHTHTGARTQAHGYPLGTVLLCLLFIPGAMSISLSWSRVQALL